MHKAEVKVIAASISPSGVPLTTFQMRYWRGIHQENLTHRMFARNAGSSRARPSLAIIEQVATDPWGPIEWGKNKPGMQADVEIADTSLAQKAWREAALSASRHAQVLYDLGLHKQVVNRVLEPFTFIDVVLTASELNNFFLLRDHKDADPTIRDLAQKMKEAMSKAEYQELDYGEWHLPYITQEDRDSVIGSKVDTNTTLCKISSARCARVSYKAFDGSVSIKKDLELYDKLMGGDVKHASPTEHIATPISLYDSRHGCLKGWLQFRKTIPNEYMGG